MTTSTHFLEHYNLNRNKPILTTPSAYSAFKTKVEGSTKTKSDSLDGNTIVLTPNKPYDVIGGVAVLPFFGFTVANCSEFEEFYYGCISLQGFCADLEQAVADDSVTSIVINFDSGGGYTMYGDETCELVKSLGQVKPIRAYTSGLMCSMAYKVACNCQMLVASPTSLVGSIGVYCEYFDYTEALKDQGIKVTTFQGGSEKTVGSPYVSLTKEQSDAIQADINQQWTEFKALVVANRGNVKDEFMQGQPFTGKEAMTMETNLIDGNVNSLSNFVGLIAQATQ